jgi:hypothetical protein
VLFSSVKLLRLCLGSRLRIRQINLAVAERAMLKFKIIKFALQCLVLASFASIVLLSKNTLTTSDAWREVTSTFLAVNVAIGNDYNSYMVNKISKLTTQ